MLWLKLSVVFLTSTLATFLLSRAAPSLKLLAEPGEHRGHREPTPLVGGIAIYLAILLGFMLVDNSFYRLLPCLFFLFIVGVIDDRYTLPSWSRLLAQALAAFLMIKLAGVQLTSLGYLLPGQEVLLGRWSTPMTIFACVGVINAVNMSDGMDGLAGCMVLLTLLALLFLGSDQPGLILIAMSAVGGFLVWNLRIARSSAKAFMGDAGSTMLGLLLAYLLIQASQADEGIWPVTALWLLALPLIDAVAVLIVRPLRGQSPFSADRIHYHHHLRSLGMGANGALCLALSVQVVFAVAGVAMWKVRVADHLQLFLFLFLFMVYVMFLLRKSN